MHVLASILCNPHPLPYRHTAVLAHSSLLSGESAHTLSPPASGAAGSFVVYIVSFGENNPQETTGSYCWTRVPKKNVNACVQFAIPQMTNLERTDKGKHESEKKVLYVHIHTCLSIFGTHV